MVDNTCMCCRWCDQRPNVPERINGKRDGQDEVILMRLEYEVWDMWCVVVSYTNATLTYIRLHTRNERIFSGA